MAENMTPAEEKIRAALQAGPTPGPWRFSSHPHDGNYMRITCSSDPAEGDNLRGYCGQANASFIAACNPAALVRGVAFVLHGEGWSDTSKLAEEVAALKAERKPLTEEQIHQTINQLADTVGASLLTIARAVERAHGITGD